MAWCEKNKKAVKKAINDLARNYITSHNVKVEFGSKENELEVLFDGTDGSVTMSAIRSLREVGIAMMGKIFSPIKNYTNTRKAIKVIFNNTTEKRFKKQIVQDNTEEIEKASQPKVIVGKGNEYFYNGELYATYEDALGARENDIEQQNTKFQSFNKELAKKIQDKLQKLYPEIKLNITNNPVWEQGDNVFNQGEYSRQVQYRLKAVDILTSPKAEQTFAKGKKNNWDLNKILTELQVPKEQKQIILDKNISSREEIITSLLADNSFTVEINTAIIKFLSTGGYPSRYYSNLTVPGGVNYTENEIATPAIIPSIKGHAQFATDKGIGWFRSDSQYIKASLTLSEAEVEELADARYFGVTENEYLQYLAKRKFGSTRRILEVQSDLFQKGRGKKDLVTYDSGLDPALYRENFDSIEEMKEYEKNSGMTDNKSKENQFLQLLNKKNNWVTFFVKSIIQDSAKKGYEKVLFPKGDTAARIEGHPILEQVKQEKEDLIEELENSFKEKPLKNWAVSVKGDDFGVMDKAFVSKTEAQDFIKNRTRNS